MKAVACDTVDHLQEGDRILVLRARDGDPVLHTDAMVRPSPSPGRKNLHACIRSIRQGFFLSRADVAKAVAAAFDDLSKQPEGYRRCLLVVSAGNLSSYQMRQIRRLAAAYRFHGWPVGFLVRKNASRDLFLVASQGELDVMFLDDGDVPAWLDGIRHAHVETEGPTPNVRDPQAETESAKPAEPPQAEKEEKLDEPRPASSDPEARSGSEDTPPDRIGDKGDPNRLHLPPDVPEPEPNPPESVPATPRKRSWLRALVAHEYAPAVGVGVVTVGLIVLVVLATRSSGRGGDLPALDESGEFATPHKLMCTAGEQEYDLGEEEHIHTLVIGNGVTSAVPLMDDEELEDEHVKIIHRRKGWQIKNLAEQPTVVDGTTVKKNGKTDLLPSATIELTPQTRITLARQAMTAPDEVTQTEGESYENDAL